MDLGLADSVCLVTGSTGGIGLETAKLLRAEGATVVTTGRSGGDVQADLSRPGEPERVVGETIERLSSAAPCSCPCVPCSVHAQLRKLPTRSMPRCACS